MQDQTQPNPAVGDALSHKDRYRKILALIFDNAKRPTRPDLLEPSGSTEAPPVSEALKQLAAHPTSMTLRHLDCGSCNGCELQLNALTSSRYDMERYGISFESSPRHAVYLAMTGPFTRGLREAALLTLRAMPKPAIIAIGDCAADGGVFSNCDFGVNYALAERPDEIKNACVCTIRGCPPVPWAILDALAKVALGAR